MIDISSARVEKIIIHKSGNKLREEGVDLSIKELSNNEQLNELILKYYLATLVKAKKKYVFYHESDIHLNEINQFSSSIFEDKINFIEKSQNIAKHLYRSSTHPKIIGGELIVILFKDIIVDGLKTEAIGLIKIESKNIYLDINSDSGAYRVTERVGISLEKIQKGVLIFKEKDEVFIVGSVNKNSQYWLESFLRVKLQSTSQSRAKVGCDFLKSVSSKIEVVESRINFTKDIQDAISGTDILQLNDLYSISKKYLDEKISNEALESIKNKAGFDLKKEEKIETKYLEKYSKNLISQTKLIDGLTLLSSNNSNRISKIEIKEEDKKTMILLEISMQEGEK